MKRRKFLAGFGAVTLVVAAGVVWRATDQRVFSVGKGAAYEPWVFRITANRIELYADTARNLGTFDSYLREMHLGLGCALENIALAAAANGYRPAITLSAGRLEKIAMTPVRPLVATVELAGAPAERSSLYEAIPRRHTHRGAYDLQRRQRSQRCAQWPGTMPMSACISSLPKRKLQEAAMRS